jgi:hypothetical protein
VAFGDVCAGSQRLARHAATGPQGSDALAQGYQKRILFAAAFGLGAWGKTRIMQYSA